MISAVLTVLAATASLSVNSLVLLTFLGGAIAALIGPTWQSIVPELIPKDELKGAIALNSLGFNIARAIGPAVGGLLLALAGAAVTYGINVLTYLFVITALLWWRRAPKRDDQLADRFGGAMRAGVRFALASPELRRVLFRAVARERRAEFLAVVCRLSGERRRDGAFGWGVAEDASAPETILEWFFVESWAEHHCQASGMTPRTNFWQTADTIGERPTSDGRRCRQILAEDSVGKRAFARPADETIKRNTGPT
jgi:MFS family permease